MVLARWMHEPNARCVGVYTCCGDYNWYTKTCALFARSQISLLRRRGHSGNHAIGMKDQTEIDSEVKKKKPIYKYTAKLKQNNQIKRQIFILLIFKILRDKGINIVSK